MKSEDVATILRFFISFFLSCLHGILLIISSTSYKYYLFVFKLFVSDTVLVHISSPKHLDRCGFFSIKFRNSKKNIPYPGFYTPPWHGISLSDKVSAMDFS